VRAVAFRRQSSPWDCDLEIDGLGYHRAALSLGMCTCEVSVRTACYTIAVQTFTETAAQTVKFAVASWEAAVAYCQIAKVTPVIGRVRSSWGLGMDAHLSFMDFACLYHDCHLLSLNSSAWACGLPCTIFSKCCLANVQSLSVPQGVWPASARMSSQKS
jgi:hypothetical protein